VDKERKSFKTQLNLVVFSYCGVEIVLKLNRTSEIVSNNLIARYNQADRRFHMLSCFLRKEKPAELTFYALQLMLLTFMQQNYKMV
jgi:hypothetical protein